MAHRPNGREGPPSWRAHRTLSGTGRRAEPPSGPVAGDAPPANRASLLDRLGDPSDGEAWARFVEIFGPLVYIFARRGGLPDAEAADLVQEVLCAVAGAIG